MTNIDNERANFMDWANSRDGVMDASAMACAMEGWLARAQSDKAVSVEALEEAYRLGFIAACKWSEPVTQDADSKAFAFDRHEDLRALIAKETGNG